MKQLFPLTPVTLIECLEQIRRLKNIVLYTDASISWLIGHYDSLSIDKACALVKEYHIDNHKAFLTLGDSKNQSGIYGVGPDNTNQCLFQIIKKEAE
jgi:hypothetical protein